MSRPRLVLGQKPELAVHMHPRLEGDYTLVKTRLAECPADTVDVVVPLCLADYDVLRSDPAFDGKALFPSRDVVGLCHDKLAFRRWFATHFGDAYLPSRGRSPLQIVRPKEGEWGKGAYLVESSNLEELARACADPAVFVEDYVFGPREYALHLIVDAGRVLFSALSAYDHAATAYVRSGSYLPEKQTFTLNPDVPEIFTAMLSRMNYRGTLCCDYKVDATGQIKIFEVNPRFGGSLTCFAREYVEAYVRHLSSRIPR